MDFIKAQLDRIQQQLAGLSATQKMLTASLVAIMVITVIYWGRYASESEMVPLVGQSLSAEQQGQMRTALSDRGIPSELSGDRLMVPADRRIDAVSALTYAKVMPHITNDDFKDIVKDTLSQMGAFDPESKDERLWNIANQQFLSKVIGAMPGVAQPDVIINPVNTRSLDGAGEPSASVSIHSADGADVQAIVDSAAALVASAQSGLTPKHVTVVVNGVVQHVRDPQNDQFAAGSDQLKQRQTVEAYEAKKVRDTFRSIGDLLAVDVTVSIDITSTETDTQRYAPKGTVELSTSTSETDETTGGSGPGGEAGTVPNTGLPPQAAAAPSGPSNTHEKTSETNHYAIGQSHIVQHSGPGKVTVEGAAVQVPSNYFVSQYLAENPGAKEPTPAVLAPLIKAKLTEMQKTVATILTLPADKVIVGTYPYMPSPDAVPPPATASTAGVGAIVGTHFKDIALSTLAALSLFMASMMVRKSVPAVVPAAAASQRAPAILSGEMPAGEAGGGDAMLDAMELNEETIKAQQMVEQVSTMVRENPDAAASLVKRWLSRT